MRCEIDSAIIFIIFDRIGGRRGERRHCWIRWGQKSRRRSRRYRAERGRLWIVRPGLRGLSVRCRQCHDVSPSTNRRDRLHLSNNLQSTHYGLPQILQIPSFTMFYCSDHTTRIKGIGQMGIIPGKDRGSRAGCTPSPPRHDSPRHHRNR
jgi:hypothetical protein